MVIASWAQGRCAFSVATSPLQFVTPQKSGRKMTTAPENKGEEKKPLAPVFAEKLISPHRKAATWAPLPKDRSAKFNDHERRHGSCEEEEDKNAELGQDKEGDESSSGGSPACHSTWMLDGFCENPTLQKVALAIPG